MIWFGVDDSGTTVRFPIYGSATRVPAAFAGKGAQDGVVAPMMEFDLQSAFYVFNLLANFAYNRWDLMSTEIQRKIQNLEDSYQSQVRALESEIFDADEKSIIERVTSFSEEIGNQLVKDWLRYFGELFVKYRDGYIITKDENNKACGCNPAAANVPEDWRDRIVQDTKDHYYDLGQDVHGKLTAADSKPHLRPVSKKSLKALQ